MLSACVTVGTRFKAGRGRKYCKPSVPRTPAATEMVTKTNCWHCSLRGEYTPTCPIGGGRGGDTGQQTSIRHFYSSRDAQLT